MGFKHDGAGLAVKPAVSGDPGAGFWWSPRAFALYLALYVAFFFALRLVLVHVAGVDDVTEIVFGQGLQWAYQPRQPPLYTWLLQGAFAVFGVNLVALAILRYGLIATGFAFTYLGARHTFRDPRIVLLAGLSPLLIYTIGWQVHVGYSNTLLIILACPMTYWAVVRLKSTQSVGAYAMLGIAVAAGFLAKYGYALFLVGILVASFREPRLRAALLRPRALVAITVAALLVGPYFAWGFPNEHTFVYVFDTTMRAGNGRPYFVAVAGGLWSLARAIVGFLFPFFIVAGVLFAYAFRADPERRRPPDRDFDPRRFFETFLAVVLGILVLSVFIAEVTYFKARWMHPALMLAPFYVLVFVERAGVTFRRVTTYLVTTAVLTALVALVFVGQLTLGPPLCHRCRLLAPFPALAAQLKAAGFKDGTVVAADEHIAGNLRLLLKPVRVAAATYPFYAPLIPHDAAGQCMLVWYARQGKDVPAQIRRYIAWHFDAELPSGQSAPLVSATRRSSSVEEAYEEATAGPAEANPNNSEEEYETVRLRYLLFDHGLGGCH